MKKTLSVLFILILTLSLVPQVNAANTDFKDVPKNHANYAEIMFLVDKGVIKPTENFFPDKKVTREEVAVMVSKAVGLDGKQTQTKFKDVPESRYSSGYINSAVEAGIINGYPDGTFKPNNLVTRGHMAAFIANAFKLTGQADIKFKDVPKGSTSYIAVRKLAFLNITSGYGDGTFKPNESLSRAHFSAFLARSMNPAFRPVSKRKVYLDLVTKSIMLNNVTTFMSKSEVISILGKPQREYIDIDYNQELVQEYPGMSIFYSGEIVESIIAKVSEKEFFNKILPDFAGRKFTDREGHYVLYSKEAKVIALYKYENGKTSIYLFWGGDFDREIKDGNYIEIK
ncbi:S-layer homology domain-containing protein [Sporosarcina sp. ANT_H38]|uniref:S-layer homology domain-containing protein n=1 Tax=unclassified Sporosarcina TaxID=2647733 RepID=UPI0011F23A3C|nr:MULTISPECIES: S-layer homology domain-containing protein [unclassified Sporosarcina]KAA0940157.1 S-layer homology domain-containing protein [Sporosarcina sp. ANT_H38]QJS06543.1 N-acetylmuramoyl-L-alanine amidase [Sporosarcina sp.]